MFTKKIKVILLIVVVVNVVYAFINAGYILENNSKAFDWELSKEVLNAIAPQILTTTALVILLFKKEN